MLGYLTPESLVLKQTVAQETLLGKVELFLNWSCNVKLPLQFPTPTHQSNIESFGYSVAMFVGSYFCTDHEGGAFICYIYM